MLAHLASAGPSPVASLPAPVASLPAPVASPSSRPDPLSPRVAPRTSQSWIGASQARLKTAFDHCESNMLGESTEPELQAHGQNILEHI